MNTAKISIIMAAYNAEQYIEETLRSIYAQTYADFHIYVIDDGSTDSTPAIISQFKEKLSYIKQSNSGSPSGPRNSGISLSQSDYIAIFDADDIMLPDKLAQQVALLEKHPEISLVCTDFQPFDERGDATYSWLGQAHIRQLIDSIPQTTIENARLFNRPIYPEILKNNFIGTSTVVARRKDLLAVGLFDETLAGAEDRDVWMKLAKSGKRFACIDQTLSKYRLSANSLSHSMRFLESQVRYYKRLLKSETDKANKIIMRTRLAQRAFEYGWKLKNNGEFFPSMNYQVTCLYYGNLRQRWLAVKSLIKLPLFWLHRKIKSPVK